MASRPVTTAVSRSMHLCRQMSHTSQPLSKCQSLQLHKAIGDAPRNLSSRRNYSVQSSSRRAEAAAKPTVTASPPATKPTTALSSGFSDEPLKLQEDDPSQVDWTSSFHGLSVEPFAKEAADVLLAPISPDDIEIKPDGIIYLPEIKYRRILNKAFGPGGWGLAPRGETIVTDKAVTREYALLAHGRSVLE
jgi:Mitochondrial genome maintenance MGM101